MDRKYCGKACNNRHWKLIRAGKMAPNHTVDPQAALSLMTGEQLGWVVGIIEGEGSISTTVTERIQNAYVYSVVVVSMTDEDVIERLREYTGIGRVSGPHLPPSRLHHKPTWSWTVTKAADVDALLTKIEPLLGKRRQGQAAALRERMSERTLKRAC